MTTLISNNLSNPKLSEFIKPYSDWYKSGSLDFDLIVAKCAECVEGTIEKIRNQPETRESNYGKLLQFRDILELNIGAKQHYYTHTFFGKIDAFFQTFFRDKFGFSTSIEKAKTVLAKCEDTITSPLLNGLELPLSEEEQNLKSAIDLSRMYAFAKKQVYVHSIEEKTNHSGAKKPKKPHGEILFAKPNGDVYYLSRLEKPLGKGASRQVYKGYLHTPGSKYTPFSKKKIAILTTMPKDDLNQFGPRTRPMEEKKIKINTQNMQREQIQLRQLKNIEGIIHNRDFFVAQIDNVPTGFAMTDLYELGDLNKFLKSLKDNGLTLAPKDKLSLMKSLSKIINDLQSQKKIYRDFKNQNIVVERDNKTNELKAVLLDFESCIDSNDKKRKKGIAGTLEYLSPEYYKACETDNGDEIAKATNPAIDMWALGLIYYRIWYGTDLREVLSPGKTPTTALLETFTFIEGGKNNTEQNNTEIFPDTDMGRMIKRMLAYDPKERLNASQLNAFWNPHTGQ